MKLEKAVQVATFRGSVSANAETACVTVCVELQEVFFYL
jgi:hypothetical protein